MIQCRINTLIFTLWVLGFITMYSVFIFGNLILYDVSLKQSKQPPFQNEMYSDQVENPHVACTFERSDGMAEPSLEYEQLRRRIHSNIGEMWNYFNGELQQLRRKVNMSKSVTTEEIDVVLQLGAEHKRSLLSNMERLRQVDGYEKWREQISKNLSDLVQRRLRYLQNPKDCQNARKLVCKLNKGCGYGCQLHHVVYCSIVAYATERTMVLKSHDWLYKINWEKVFLPVSETCLEADLVQANDWPGKNDTQVLLLPKIDNLKERPHYLPVAFPEDLAPCLKRLHGDPFVWWAGQFLKYLFRPQENKAAFLKFSKLRLGWQKPIVGVHVRRTDKVGTEAAFHSIEEYMSHVEDYFLTLEINGSTTIPRRIFLASDDARVIEEARKKYPQYEVIGDPEVARMAAVSTRYTDTALNGIILDIHLLSLCDYLVCTFSSQVCRVAYEIMQTLQPDAAHRFKSLDDIYYYGGQNAHNRQVVIGHKARNDKEIDMRRGDLIHVTGNHWNGYSEGENLRTKKSGLFPSFKVIDKMKTVPMPLYEQVPIRK